MGMGGWPLPHTPKAGGWPTFTFFVGGNDEVGGHGWKIGTQVAFVPPL